MSYGSDFYQGYPCVTYHEYGKGKAWYVAATAEKDFYADFLGRIVKESDIVFEITEQIPDALEITVRESETDKYYIYQNFGTEAVKIPAPEGDITWIFGDPKETLKVYGLAVIKKKK